MTSRKKNISFIICTTMSVNIFASDIIYIVKKGDTVTSVLYKENLHPVYGKRGTFSKTLNLNPGLRRSLGNKIYPSMKIILPKEELVKDVEVALEEPVKSDIERQENKVVDRLPTDDFKQTFYWKISPTLSWKNITSKDESSYASSRVNTLSNMNYGASISYGMHFEEQFDIYSMLALESVSFIEDKSINLSNRKTTTSSFLVGLLYEKKWGIEVGFSDQFFLTSPAAASVEIEKISLPQIKASYLKDFYNYRAATLSYSLSGNAFLPHTSPEIKSNLSYGAGAVIGAKINNQSFGIGYEVNLLKADRNSTSYQNIFWKYIWETL
jgi:hypothetical protein